MAINQRAINFRLEPEIWEALVKNAKAADRTKANYIRHWLGQHLAEQKEVAVGTPTVNKPSCD